jgi:hypothetical protein
MSVPQPDLRLRLDPMENDAQAENNQGMQLYPGDRLMLCTDGLTDLVMDDEILNILHAGKFDQIPPQFINLANQRGGHDNITVVVLEVPQVPSVASRPTPEAQPLSAPKQKARRSAASWWMIALLSVAILAMVLLWVYWSIH